MSAEKEEKIQRNVETMCRLIDGGMPLDQALLKLYRQIADREEEIASYKKWVDIAKEMGQDSCAGSIIHILGHCGKYH